MIRQASDVLAGLAVLTFVGSLLCIAALVGG